MIWPKGNDAMPYANSGRATTRMVAGTVSKENVPASPAVLVGRRCRPSTGSCWQATVCFLVIEVSVQSAKMPLKPTGNGVGSPASSFATKSW